MQAIIITMLALAAIVIVLRVILFRRQDASEGGMSAKRIGDRLRRLNENKARYAVMTPALLAQTPDDALLEAVLANLWAKMAPDLVGAPRVMGSLSRERQYVYALYAVTGGIKQDGVRGLLDGEDAVFVPTAEEALAALRLQGSADVLREALDAPDPDLYQEAYLESFAAENGKDAMVAFIRAHEASFCDAA